MVINGKKMVDVTGFIADDYDHIQTIVLVNYAKKNHPELINRNDGRLTMSLANLARVEKEFKGESVFLFKAI